MPWINMNLPANRVHPGDRVVDIEEHLVERFIAGSTRSTMDQETTLNVCDRFQPSRAGESYTIESLTRVQLTRWFAPGEWVAPPLSRKPMPSFLKECGL